LKYSAKNARCSAGVIRLMRPRVTADELLAGVGQQEVGVRLEVRAAALGVQGEQLRGSARGRRALVEERHIQDDVFLQALDG
jgi:hypothetical protein